MDSIVELVKRNEQLLLENAEALNDEEVEQEDIDEYLKIQGATKEELSAFENQFQIRLPEDFKTVYSYKNGSGYMSLIWPQEGFYRGYRLLPSSSACLRWLRSSCSSRRWRPACASVMRRRPPPDLPFSSFLSP